MTGESASPASSLPETTAAVASLCASYWSMVISGFPAAVHFCDRAVMSSTCTVAFWTAETDGSDEPLEPEPPDELLVELSPHAVRTSASAASVATPARRVRELLDNGGLLRGVRLVRPTG